MSGRSLDIQQIQDFSKFSTTQAYQKLMDSYKEAEKPMKDASVHIVSLRNLTNRGYSNFQNSLAPPTDLEKLKEVQLALHALQLRLHGVYTGAQILLVNFTNGVRFLDRPALNLTTMQTIEVMAPKQHTLIVKADKQRLEQLTTLRFTENQISSQCKHMGLEEPKLISAIHFFDTIAAQQGKQLTTFSRVILSTPLSSYNSFEKEVGEKGDELEPMMEQLLKGTTPLDDLAAVSEPATQNDGKGKQVGGGDSDAEPKKARKHTKKEKTGGDNSGDEPKKIRKQPVKDKPPLGGDSNVDLAKVGKHTKKETSEIVGDSGTEPTKASSTPHKESLATSVDDGDDELEQEELEKPARKPTTADSSRSYVPPLPSRKPTTPLSNSFAVEAEPALPNSSSSSSSSSSASSTSGHPTRRTPSRQNLTSDSTSTSALPPGIGRGKTNSKEIVST
jgi:hypothetical protein